jgi:hypothetical protein
MATFFGGVAVEPDDLHPIQQTGMVSATLAVAMNSSVRQIELDVE